MTRSKIVIALTFCSALTLPAFADTYRIDYSVPIGSAGGTVTSTGGFANFTGTNITISELAYFLNGAKVGATHAVTGACAGMGCLNFDTAANTVTVVGAVADLGLASQTLLTGTYTQFTGNALLFAGRGNDTKSRAMLAKLGVPGFAGFTFGQTNIYNPLNGSAIFADVSNFADTPDGGVTAMLLGGAMLGIHTLRRKLRA
jgi:hypothetical protein